MRISLAIACLVGLTACAPQHYAKSYFQEAGSDRISNDIGPANTHNISIQSDPHLYAVNMANRFASEVNDMVNFEFDSATLDQEARQILTTQATWIRQFPEIRFRVYGHTDAVGSAGYNKQLGYRRAQAVVAFLATQGIGRDRLEAMVSYGKTRPLVNTQDRERKNRRTVTEVSGFVERHPTVMDGKYAEIIYRDYIASAVPPTQLSGTVTNGSSSE